MRLTVDTGIKKDLTGKQMATLDSKLRTIIPQLIGWSYSPLTGELNLDFSDVEDSALLTKIEDWKAKCDSVAKLRFEFMEMTKEWQR